MFVTDVKSLIEMLILNKYVLSVCYVLGGKAVFWYENDILIYV